MKKITLALFILSILSSHFAWSYPNPATKAVIFNGANVKALKQNIDLNGNVTILSGTVDPTSVATSANKGSIYLNNSSANVYQKTDNGSSTNWTLIPNSTSSGPALVVDGYYVGDGACTWSRAGTTFGSWGGGGTCNTITTEYVGTGAWSMGTQVHGSPTVVINNLPAGLYEAVFTFNVLADVNNAQMFFRITDSVTPGGVIAFNGSRGLGGTNIVRTIFSYVSSGNRTFSFETANNMGGGNVASIAQIVVSPAGGPVRFSLWKWK